MIRITDNAGNLLPLLFPVYKNNRYLSFLKQKCFFLFNKFIQNNRSVNPFSKNIGHHILCPLADKNIELIPIFPALLIDGVYQNIIICSFY